MSKFVYFDTVEATSVGRVAINPEHVASVFQQKGSPNSAIVLDNTIGYIVKMELQDVVAKLRSFSSTDVAAQQERNPPCGI